MLPLSASKASFGTKVVCSFKLTQACFKSSLIAAIFSSFVPTNLLASIISA